MGGKNFWKTGGRIYLFVPHVFAAGFLQAHQRCHWSRLPIGVAVPMPTVGQDKVKSWLVRRWRNRVTAAENADNSES
ncbi:hypothetical protein RMSM_06571 [Rhodopirellula maiorica SM1]|uniref:Uncharacterized protein n=1 Tax=Rhodopirellula maiorica SM1 TaxID=1265738 RepID=M5RAV3_9BACT|nr:hypothetical protein RMSM_06571 [Rhodopirellula maiorica SM1]